MMTLSVGPPPSRPVTPVIACDEGSGCQGRYSVHHPGDAETLPEPIRDGQACHLQSYLARRCIAIWALPHF